MPDEEYLKGVAYHEAAHLVLAAALGLPITDDGVCLYDNGEGRACYKLRKPDGSENLGSDADRERSIIVCLAGKIVSVGLTSAL